MSNIQSTILQAMTDAEEREILEELVDDLSADHILAIPDIYSDIKEHLNNEIIKEWEENKGQDIEDRLKAKLDDLDWDLIEDFKDGGNTYAYALVRLWSNEEIEAYQPAEGEATPNWLDTLCGYVNPRFIELKHSFNGDEALLAFIRREWPEVLG